MQPQDLKEKMMKLWKDTFHDSDAYINLIFSNYFNPEYIEYHEENGRLVSALLGIPFDFKRGKRTIRGLYLCGLATAYEFRHHGIMTRLIESINHRAKELGFAFTFLIPASDILRNFYIEKEYENAIYNVEDRYTDVHDFDADCRALLQKEEPRVSGLKLKYYENLRVDVIDSIDHPLIESAASYIETAEQSDFNYTGLVHSRKDCICVIKENIISGGNVAVCSGPDGKITGVLFATFDDRKRIIIPKIYHDDNCSYFKLLNKIKRLYSELSMSVICFPEETERRVLWSKSYVAANPDGAPGGAYGVTERIFDVNRHARPYGMVRITDIVEILKFLTNDGDGCKYSILVKEGISEEISLICRIDNGKILVEEILTELVRSQLNEDKSLTVLSKKNLAKILFRKKDANNLIMEALGIPRLGLNMALLLD